MLHHVSLSRPGSSTRQTAGMCRELVHRHQFKYPTTLRFPVWAEAGHLFDDVEFDSVQEGVVINGTGMRGSFAEGFEVVFSRAPQVSVIDGGKRDHVDGVDLDLAVEDAVPTAFLHLRPGATGGTRP